MSVSTGIRFYEWRVEYVPTKPSVLVIEATTRCNLSCIHCFRRGMGEGFRDLEMGEFRKVMAEAVGWGGVRRVTFTGWGEPTVHPDILEMISEARQAAREVCLSTNGVRLAEIAEDIIRLGVDELFVSIDSADVNTYGRIRGGARLTDVVDGLLTLKDLKLRKRLAKPTVTLIFTITTLNYRQVLQAAALAREVMANRIVYSNVIPPKRGLSGLTCLGRDECVREVEAQVSEVSREAMGGSLGVQAAYMRVRSYFLCPFIGYGATYVCSDGSIAPCMYFAHSWRPTLYGIERRVGRVVFGSVAEGGVLKAWRSPDYVRFRFQVRAGMTPSCLDCELASYCSYTLDNTTDCLGNTPSCAACPFAKNLAFCPV